MPQIVNEIDKKCDVKNVIFYSSHEAIIVAKDTKASNAILDLLCTLIRNSGFDGAEKLGFTIASTNTTTVLYPAPHKALVVNGDLNQVAHNLLQTKCISNDVFQKLTVAVVNCLMNYLITRKKNLKVTGITILVSAVLQDELTNLFFLRPFGSHSECLKKK
jgi:hypothetical protein